MRQNEKLHICDSMKRCERRNETHRDEWMSGSCDGDRRHIRSLMARWQMNVYLVKCVATVGGSSWMVSFFSSIFPRYLGRKLVWASDSTVKSKIKNRIKSETFWSLFGCGAYLFPKHINSNVSSRLILIECISCWPPATASRSCFFHTIFFLRYLF